MSFAASRLAEQIARRATKEKLRLSRLGKEMLDLIYPGRCMACPAQTDGAGLCPECWRTAGFITGTACTHCGTPLPDAGHGKGQDEGESGDLICDECLRYPVPWRAGRALMLYDGTGRRLVLGLKHGDRPELAIWAGGMLARVGADLLARADLVAPVPLHRWRLFRRRYNQSAELARATLAACQGAAAPALVPDLLLRTRRTRSLEGLGRQERHELLRGAIAVHPRHLAAAQGRHVLLVDDVLTSGASLGACTEALHQAGVRHVDILVMARVARENSAPILP